MCQLGGEPASGETFWRRLGDPVRARPMLGTGAADRKAALAGLMAPDFTLRDPSGTPRTLSDLRGQARSPEG